DSIQSGSQGATQMAHSRRFHAATLLLCICATVMPALSDTTSEGPIAIEYPPIDASKDELSNAAPPDFKLDATEQKLLDYLDNDQFAEGRKLLQTTLEHDKIPRPELLYLLAYIDSQTENYKAA